MATPSPTPPPTTRPASAGGPTPSSTSCTPSRTTTATPSSLSSSAASPSPPPSSTPPISPGSSPTTRPSSSASSAPSSSAGSSSTLTARTTPSSSPKALAGPARSPALMPKHSLPLTPPPTSSSENGTPSCPINLLGDLVPPKKIKPQQTNYHQPTIDQPSPQHDHPKHTRRVIIRKKRDKCNRKNRQAINDTPKKKIGSMLVIVAASLLAISLCRSFDFSPISVPFLSKQKSIRKKHSFSSSRVSMWSFGAWLEALPTFEGWVV